MRLRWADAVAEIALPVAVLPVKLMTGTNGERTSASPVSRPPVTTLITPTGNSSVSAMISAIRVLVCAVWAGRLTTTVAPAAKAGANERMLNATGEFQGAMMPTTPAGCLRTIPRSSCPTRLARPVSVKASAALNRKVSGTIATSTSA